MQFLITAFDGTDSEALSRRLAVRAAHIELGNKYRDKGNHLYAAAILNDTETLNDTAQNDTAQNNTAQNNTVQNNTVQNNTGQMIGSVMIVEFNSRAELDSWLAEEPYVTGNVWQKIDIKPCKVAPSFCKPLN